MVQGGRMTVRLVRAQRPQTRNNFHMLIVKETENQFQGLKVSFDAFAEDYGYMAINVPIFGGDTETCEVLSYLNKLHCTDYVVAEVEESEIEDETLEMFRNLEEKHSE